MFPKTKIIHNSFCLKIVKIISWTISQFSMPVIVLCKNKVVSSWKKFRMHLTIIRNAVIVIIRVFNIGNSCNVPSVGYNLNYRNKPSLSSSRSIESSMPSSSESRAWEPATKKTRRSKAERRRRYASDSLMIWRQWAYWSLTLDMRHGITWPIVLGKCGGHLSACHDPGATLPFSYHPAAASRHHIKTRNKWSISI